MNSEPKFVTSGLAYWYRVLEKAEGHEIRTLQGIMAEVGDLIRSEWADQPVGAEMPEANWNKAIPMLAEYRKMCADILARP